ncbi:MAG: S1C family serine protease [Bacteroidales bacterium]|nr:S1C family serine protease [Lachnoclostridium sp.]MCM1384883.1 S1C family serine protease [Lachnoclostridium sp.]MCM1465593.1 S1C family serine protease [Bacteroidales bacterium]
MSEKERNEPIELGAQNEFLMEKIKERPVNRRKLIRRTITTAALAVIFGLIACVTFLVLEPVINNWLYPEKEPQVVVFPEDQEEIAPEDMLVEDPAHMQDTEWENIALEEEQIRQILSRVTLDTDSYKQIYGSLSSYAKEINRSMVTVTGVTSNTDWFNDVQESRNQASGVIIYNNGREVLVLVEYTPLRKAESLTLTFYNGIQTEADLKAQDAATNLAVIAVDLDKLSEEFIENDLKIAPLGASNLSSIVGTPVVAVGSPMGTNNSLGYGMVSAASGQQTQTDAHYKLLQTDIMGSQNAGGILFNLQGQVLGIITNNKSGSDMKNMITAYGISELKRRIEKMSNGEAFAYLGINGVDVTHEINQELGVPYGAYIKEVAMDSPAMLAGIRKGDVIVEMNDKSIDSFSTYVTNLLQCSPGETVKLIVKRQAQNEYRELTFTVILGTVK